jgi:hypothetical protein
LFALPSPLTHTLRRAAKEMLILTQCNAAIKISGDVESDYRPKYACTYCRSQRTSFSFAIIIKRCQMMRFI